MSDLQAAPGQPRLIDLAEGGPEVALADLPPLLHRSLILPAVLLGFALLGVILLFAASMVRPVTYDEDQYIAAGVFARDLLPYRDFVYLQPPLYPFVLAAVFKLTGGWFLLSGRLLTFTLGLISAVLLWRLLRRLGADAVLASVLMAACLASPFLLAPLANTRNDALPLALMLGGLLLHLWSVDRSWIGSTAAALLFGLAVEAKLTYLFGSAALGVHALFALRTRLAPYVLGTAVAAIPGVLCFAMAPEAFRFGLLDYHLAAPADWYGRQGLGEMLLPPAKAEALLDWLSTGGNLTLALIAVALMFVTMARHRKWKRPGRLLVGMLLAATALAFVPSPSWSMYYAPIAPLLACCIAHLDRITTHLADPRRKRILILIAGLASVPVLVLNGPELIGLAHPSQWVGVVAHQNAVEIRKLIVNGGEIATLFPRTVIDANPVPREFASGPFVYRSGDLWSAEKLARLHALSPATVAAAFNYAPPAAIYAGLYPNAFRQPMDTALSDYAEQHDWRLVRIEPDGGRLWVRP